MRRYGRLLAKHAIDAADLKFLQQMALAQAALDRRLDGLAQAAAAAAAGGRGPSPRAALRQLQEEGERLLASCKELVKSSAAAPNMQAYDAARRALAGPLWGPCLPLPSFRTSPDGRLLPLRTPAIWLICAAAPLRSHCLAGPPCCAWPQTASWRPARRSSCWDTWSCRTRTSRRRCTRS